MDSIDVFKLASAIAKANGHPDDIGWATKVVEAFEAPQVQVTPTDSPESTPPV